MLLRYIEKPVPMARGVDLAFDGVHFTAPGHRAFAAGLPERLRQDGFLAPGA